MNKGNYRNEALLRTARGQPCMVNIPGICNGNKETTVCAHSNWYEHGKGAGLKANDCFVAWCCSACHAELDQGKNLDGEEKKVFWRRGFEKTLLALFKLGWIKVIR